MVHRGAPLVAIELAEEPAGEAGQLLCRIGNWDQGWSGSVLPFCEKDGGVMAKRSDADTKAGMRWNANARAAMVIIAYSSGGVISALYNNWAIILYHADIISWQEWDNRIQFLIDFLSYLVPIITLIPNSLLDHGYIVRSGLVRHLYAIDWAICIITSITALPLIFGYIKRAKIGVNTAIRNAKNAEDTRQIYFDFWLALFAAGGAVALIESWLGLISYSGRGLFQNHVQDSDADLYRLCLFIPLALLFGTIAASAAYIRRYYNRAKKAK
jgi:hypothetical protein